MSLKTPFKLNQAGDTIVEVMMVILVLGTVIASTYAIAVNSLQSIQLTQERSFALKLAEGQVENLKSAVTSGPASGAIVASTVGFCLTNNGTTIAKTDLSGGAPAATADADSLSSSNYPVDCRVDPNDPDPSKPCNSYCYYVGIRRNTSGAQIGEQRRFMVTVRWVSAKGHNQQVSLAYKVYEND